MDLYNHAASGAVVGLALASVSWRGRRASRRLAVAGCAIGAVLPDLDAISFGLGAWGRAVYHGEHWYSHHQASHSLLGCAALAILGALAWRLWRARRGEAPDGRPLVLFLFAGALVHLLGDLPTPAGPWGGLPLLYPLEARFGGWGIVWWWRHWYVFAVLASALLAAAAIGAGERRSAPLRRLGRPLQSAVALVALALVLRYFALVRFDGGGTWHEKDRRAVELQAEWLPGPVHAGFARVSALLPGWF